MLHPSLYIYTYPRPILQSSPYTFTPDPFYSLIPNTYPRPILHSSPCTLTPDPFYSLLPIHLSQTDLKLISLYTYPRPILQSPPYTLIPVLLISLTFTRHCLRPLVAFTSGAYFLRWLTCESLVMDTQNIRKPSIFSVLKRTEKEKKRAGPPPPPQQKYFNSKHASCYNDYLIPF